MYGSPTTKDELKKLRSNPLFRLLEKEQELRSNEKDGLLGRLLTLVEATTADEKQRESLKSIIRQMVWGEPNYGEILAEIFKAFSEKYEGKMIEKLAIKGFSLTKGNGPAIDYFPDQD